MESKYFFSPPFFRSVFSVHPFRSPGYALSLLAESTTGALHCAEAVSKPGVPPEDIARQATYALLEEIKRGGCVDRSHQILVLLMMVLGSEDIGRCRMGEPSPRTYVFPSYIRGCVADAIRFLRIQFLRDVREVFGVSFKIAKADATHPDSTDLIFSCLGTGYVNANRTLA